MLDPPLVRRIVESIKAEVTIPVTVKCRIGVDSSIQFFFSKQTVTPTNLWFTLFLLLAGYRPHPTHLLKKPWNLPILPQPPKPLSCPTLLSMLGNAG